MTKIIVLAVVAILVAAAAGLTMGPGYVLIQKSFENKGGSSYFESNTSIPGFGTSNIWNEATSNSPNSEISVYEKVELGDPGCCMKGCVELDKVVKVEWDKAAVLGAEDTVVYGWLDENAKWYTDSEYSSGKVFEKVEIDKFVFPGPPTPPCKPPICQ